MIPTDMRSNRVVLCMSVFFCSLITLSAGCTGKMSSPTPYLAPTSAFPVSTPTSMLPTTPFIPGPSATAICTNDLHFLQDLTIPDNTKVAPGSSLDKQWQVLNNGTCNWDSRYRLRFIGGEQLGVNTDQALYPARSGTQAVIRIVFTAPLETGGHKSEWQAYDPSGSPFGDSFFILIDVEPQAETTP